MRSAGSWRGVGAGSAPAGKNDTLIDSGIATLERATTMDKEGKLEGLLSTSRDFNRAFIHTHAPCSWKQRGLLGATTQVKRRLLAVYKCLSHALLWHFPISGILVSALFRGTALLLCCCDFLRELRRTRGFLPVPSPPLPALSVSRSLSLCASGLICRSSL